MKGRLRFLIADVVPASAKTLGVFVVAFLMSAVVAPRAFGQAATATWAGTANFNGSVTGNVTAAAAVSNGVNNFGFSAAGLTASGWPTSTSPSATDYYEYKMSPTTGNMFVLNTVNFTHSTSNNNSWAGAVYYSTNNFATSTQIGANFTAGTTATSFSASALGISVAAGSTLAIRVYAFDGPINTTRTFRVLNFALGGTTCSNMTIVSNPNSQTLCAGGSLTLTASATGATSVQWKKNGNNIAGATSSSYTIPSVAATDSGLYTFVATNSCTSLTSAAATVTVTPSPTSVTASASSTTVCAGQSINLTASAVSNSPVGNVTVLSENFNAAINNWTTTNTGTGGTVANADWTLRANGYTSPGQYGTTYNSNDASQFYLSNSDDQGNGSTTATVLRSPAFSTVGLSSATFSFYHYYRYNGTESATVQISTNGTAWTDLAVYTSTQGTATAFSEVSFPLAAGFLNQPTVYVRFKYDASWDYYWAVDNVLVTGVSAVSAPATFAWTSTPAGFTSNLQNPTNIIPTVNTIYTVTATNSYGCSVSVSTSLVTVQAAPIGGTTAGAATVCYGNNSGSITLSGHTGNIVRWESSLDNFATAGTTIANTTATLNYSNLTATTYYRAVLGNGVCGNVNSAVTAITVNAVTTWTGATSTAWNDATNWSCGVVPTSAVDVVIGASANQPVISGDAFAKSLVLQTGTTLSVSSGFDISVTGSISGNGTMDIANNANLIQVNNVANSSSVTVHRNSSALMRQDYTLWSSPVASQNLLAFSPATLTNRFYTYNTSTNLYNTVADPANTGFTTGKGYLIRMPNNHPNTPTVWAGQFSGIPNNGNINVPLANNGAGQRYNAIGNPYPSSISVSAFVADNSANITGTVYFWRKTNNAASPSYCSWTSGGGFVDNGEAEVADPNGVIRTGQGFIVEASAAGTSVNFNNAQRSSENANQFFRSATTIEQNRIWLNATSAAGAYCQTLVGYITDATMGDDANIDGRFFNDGAISFYSLIDSGRFVIQGRPLPFVTSDIVPMGFKSAAAGSYTIAIDHVDGLFAQGQDIFLRDNLTGTVHDLNSGAYTFAAEAGEFNDRFEILYENALAVQQPDFNANELVVYKNNGNFVVNSGSATMESIRVYDVRGRLLQTIDEINASETNFAVAGAKQVLVFKIAVAGSSEVTRKVVN